MKVLIRKVFCTKCRKLVFPVSRQEKANLLVLCPRCQNDIATWDGLHWR